MAAFHHASRRKAAFFCDKEQMDILEAVREHRGGLSDDYRFERARIFTFSGVIKAPFLSPEWTAISSRGVTEENMKTESFCMMVRNNRKFQQIIDSYTEKYPEKCLFIYSMPESYLKKHRASVEKLMDNFEYKVKLHTSGHASESAIWEAVHTLAPGKIIPVHTENPERLRLGGYQNRILLLQDGEAYEVR